MKAKQRNKLLISERISLWQSEIPQLIQRNILATTNNARVHCSIVIVRYSLVTIKALLVIIQQAAYSTLMSHICTFYFNYFRCNLHIKLSAGSYACINGTSHMYSAIYLLCNKRLVPGLIRTKIQHHECCKRKIHVFHLKKFPIF